MGIFGSRLSPEILDLKDALTDKRPGRDTALALAIVDCRLCLKAEHGVLVNETVWGLQTCKASYSYCKAARQWVSGTQGNGLAGKNGHKNTKNWSAFNLETKLASWLNESNELITQDSFNSTAQWALADFRIRIGGTKIIVEEFLRSKGEPEWILRLEKLLLEDPIIS